MQRLWTPTELAVQLWGQQENGSRRPGPRRLRQIAREMLGKAPHGRWHFDESQAQLIRTRARGQHLKP